MLRTLWTLAFVVPLSVLAQEVCNNGIDDDNNGLIDLNDPACPCATSVEPPGLQSYIRNHSFEDQMCCPFGFVHPFSPPWLSCASGWQQATTATSDYFHECGYSPVGMPLPPPDGNGAVGFYASQGYFEYVGACLTFPEPANPMMPGTTYTLSLWIAAAGANGTHSQTPGQADPSVFVEQLPLSLFGYADACVPFPIGTMDCIGYEPGWNELGRVMVQPSWQWQQVSITFTPTEEIHSVIIGGGCDVPASYSIGQTITDSDGNTTSINPYFLVDDLMLTVAQDQVMTPVTALGGICVGDAVATATPPASATGHQWYLDGVALVGQTGLTLPISTLDLDGGMYTLASTYAGECLMGSTYVLPASDPRPLAVLAPVEGCAPLAVSFADTTGATTTVLWNLGDGTFATDSAFSHTYTAPGSYDVQLSVEDLAGCRGDTLLEDAVTVYPVAVGQIDAQPSVTDTEHPLVQLSGSGSTTDIVSWWWDLGDAVPGTSAAENVGAVFPAEPGTYPVMLVVTTAAGCVDTVYSVVEITLPGVIEMPNVFSPNSDGHNDRFVPRNYNGTPGLLEVFNRWGQLLYSTRSLAGGWTGSDAPDGTYYYVVTPDDTALERQSGHVTLVR